MDELLRARLRIHEGADLPLAILRGLMYSVDAVLRSTTGQPFFALREAEDVLRDLKGKTGADLVSAMLDRNGGTTLTAHGLENIPKEGPVIIGSTHPIGTFDFLAHAGALRHHRSDVKVVANREAERFLGKDGLIPVDFDRSDKVLTARQTRDGMVRHLQNGGAMLIFGSGKVPDRKNGLLVEPPWRPGITRISKECDVPIIPASPDMRNSKHYYRTRKIARILSGNNAYIGREVASLRYSSELLHKLGGSYDLHYGPAVAPGTPPAELQKIAEDLVPGLYKPAA
ncbi:1-acyl-sn-glycerol-3-phosphate acyltransferase [Cognatishimia sp.]|uniref:1-acyl-sn-glycerol-3-phosphate acyltransferase n=1 Tax=Cognatishimia sp. TaxID=2211648 RepID=UPI0035144EED